MKILALMILGLMVVGCGKMKPDTQANPSEPTEATVTPSEWSKVNPAIVCKMKLAVLDAKIVDWMAANRMPYGAEVTMEDLLHYYYDRKPPECPSGGKYTLTSVKGERCTCTIHSDKVVISKVPPGLVPPRIPSSRIGGPPSKPTDQNSTKPTPTKELSLREKVVGSYELELKKFGETHRYVLLDNSIVEYYLDGKKEEEEHKWSIVDKEVHIERENRAVSVFSINKDESITGIARIDEDGKRKEILKEHQYTRKKIK